MVRQYEYQPCIPTRGTKVPAGPNWLHEIKHDGYRVIVQREGKRVRLFTRNGYDWSDRYPLIVQAALRLRKTSFVIDGEAVVLGSDGISDFDALHGGKRNADVRLYAFDLLADDGVDMRDELLQIRKLWLGKLPLRSWSPNSPQRAKEHDAECPGLINQTPCEFVRDLDGLQIGNAQRWRANGFPKLAQFLNALFLDFP